MALPELQRLLAAVDEQGRNPMALATAHSAMDTAGVVGLGCRPKIEATVSVTHE